ncbi:hypothetical protein ACIRBX_11430 [Kitasatospora sp. NPDC096147]|uniref:hypothetical protein n=1 Tax=Kitasatospora sp. NPDC096147 TaxID=3364093 RepID=UPI003830DB06
MNRARLDSSPPDHIDLVLREGRGPLAFAARQWAVETLGTVVIGVLGGLVVYVTLALLLDRVPLPLWVLLVITTVLALLANAAAALRNARQAAHRLRFSPAAAPDTVTVIRGSRTDPPRPATSIERIVIDHEITLSRKEGSPPVSQKITLHVLTRYGRPIRPTELSHRLTDPEALHRQLRQALAAAGPGAVGPELGLEVELVVRRRLETVETGGYGGSNGGTGGGGGS